MFCALNMHASIEENSLAKKTKKVRKYRTKFSGQSYYYFFVDLMLMHSTGIYVNPVSVLKHVNSFGQLNIVNYKSVIIFFLCDLVQFPFLMSS